MNKSPARNRVSKALRVFGPFLVLLILILGLNYLLEMRATTRTQVEMAVLQESASQEPHRSTATSVAVPPTIATAIFNASPESQETEAPTAEATPTVLPYEVAVLLGPPEDSTFGLSSPVTFYWQPSEPTGPNQLFALHLGRVVDGSSQQVATVAEPNVGSSIYSATISAREARLEPGAYHWEIRLLDAVEQREVGRSAHRAVQFGGD